MDQTAAPRVDILDSAKGLGILAVVLGHAGSPVTGFVYLYHMALFFFISGCLYNDRYTNDPWALVQRRVRTLYLPFAAYGVFFGLLHNVFFRFNIYSEQVESLHNKVFYFDTSREFIVNLAKILAFVKVEQILAPLWFLPILFIVNILFVLAASGIHKLGLRWAEWWLAAAIAAMFCIGYAFYPENNFVLRPISIALVAASMYYFGYLYKKHGHALPLTFGYAAACFTVLMIALYFVDSRIDTAAHEYISPPYYLAVSLCGIYLNLSLAKALGSVPVLGSFLRTAGKNSLAIMALHLISFKAINYVQVRTYDLPPYLLGKHFIVSPENGWWLAYVVAGMLLPLGIVAVYERVRQMIGQESRSTPVPG